ncbi:MAG: M55 family metallopeptidase [Actinomycetota bacterium]|nr:M55 family metallopeptidase [Actinomycetota bacterium]
MRIYISADMEGVLGVTRPQGVIPARSLVRALLQ